MENKYDKIVQELENFIDIKRESNKTKTFMGVVRDVDNGNGVLKIELPHYVGSDLSAGSLILLKEDLVDEEDEDSDDDLENTNRKPMGMRATIIDSYDSFLEIEVKGDVLKFAEKNVLIDKDELNVILQRLDNVAQSIKRGKIGDESKKILDFMINEDEPDYSDEEKVSFSRKLNTNQKKSVFKSVTAEDFHLIIGPPGTGKTYVIEELIEQFLGKKEKTLVTAWTNSGVDNILRRLSSEASKNVVRIGPFESIDPELREYSIFEKIKEHQDWAEIGECADRLNELYKIKAKGRRAKLRNERAIMNGLKSVTDWKSLERNRRRVKLADTYQDVKELNKEIFRCRNRISDLKKERTPKIIADIVDRADLILATAVSSCHNFLDDVKFDVMIMDEASQVSSFMSLLPLLKSKKFILVGDDKQLQPIEEEGMSTEMNLSIFNRLLKSFPDASSLLTVQHRMHKSIARISSEVFYAGKLETPDEIAGRTLALKVNKNKIFDPDNPLIFIDTSRANYYEDGGGFGCSNDKEAKCVSKVVSFFVGSGIDGRDIAVITPYVKQKNLIRNLLNDADIEGVEVDTVHKFQGREKDIVIMSFAKSKQFPSPKYDLKFIGEPSLINVSITRAKKKLILLGNSQTLCKSELLNEIISKIDESSKVVL